MPRPPRPLCLPNLVANPQARAEYNESHPPIHGPYSPLPPTTSQHDELRYPHAPPSPTSTNDANSHRASAATLSSLNSPVTPASTRTSLSVHNTSWPPSDPVRESSGSSSGLLPTSAGGGARKSWGMNLAIGLGGSETAGNKPRASWSSAFKANTKSWFGGAAAVDKDASASMETPSNRKEIKLSPSMISASTSPSSPSPRPVSSPYPPAAEPPLPSPTGSLQNPFRSPKVGSGLRYYTERNPAPAEIRIQIPDPIDLQDQPPTPANRHDPNAAIATPTLTTFISPAKQHPTVPHVTVCAISPRNLDLEPSKDAGSLRGESICPPSPPPTPPVHDRQSDVPHIRVSSGEDL